MVFKVIRIGIACSIASRSGGSSWAGRISQGEVVVVRSPADGGRRFFDIGSRHIPWGRASHVGGEGGGIAPFVRFAANMGADLHGVFCRRREAGEGEGICASIDFCKLGIACLVGHFPGCGLAVLRPAQCGGVSADVRNGQVGGLATSGRTVHYVVGNHAATCCAAKDDIFDTVFYDVRRLAIPIAAHPYEIDFASVAHREGLNHIIYIFFIITLHSHRANNAIRQHIHHLYGGAVPAVAFIIVELESDGTLVFRLTEVGGEAEGIRPVAGTTAAAVALHLHGVCGG